MQHSQMMRDGIVGQAEHHTVEWLGRSKLGGILLNEIDVGPALPCAQRARLRQHAGGNIDAVNAPARSDRCAQGRQVAPGTASDLENAAPVLSRSRSAAFPESGG